MDKKLHTRPVAITLLVVWFIVIMLLIPSITRPLTAYPAGKTTFSSLFSSHPYCAIDPTCINIVTNSTHPYLETLPDVAVAHAYTSHAALSSQNFAWPNYFLFMLVGMVLTAVATIILRRKPYLQAGALLFIAAWVIGENWRWNGTILNFNKNPFLETIWLLAGSLAILAVVWYIVRKLCVQQHDHKE